MRTFVIGNGTSRQDFDLSALRSFGKIIGCNALYRDFIPDCLVAVDVSMIAELDKFKIQHAIPVYTYKQNKIKNLQGFKHVTPNLGWSSGSTAIYLATKDAPKEIYLLGFDFISNTGNINNIYAGTENYKDKNSKPILHHNWERQITSIIKETPYINFYKVNKNNLYTLPGTYSNLFEITYEDFSKIKSSWKNA
jgi:hypothetical protein